MFYLFYFATEQSRSILSALSQHSSCLYRHASALYNTLCTITPSYIYTTWPLSQILYCSAHFSALPTLYTHIHSVYHIPFTLSIICNLRTQVLKTIHSCKGSPFSITFIRPPLPYLEHLITLLLPTLTLNFVFSHTISNSLTNLHSSESATSAVSSANNSWFISSMEKFALSNSSHFPSTLTFTSRTTPSI